MAPIAAASAGCQVPLYLTQHEPTATTQRQHHLPNQMKTVRQILLMLAGGIAERSRSSRTGTDWGLKGIRTPLEEYGLTIGDVTVSRIFNPVGNCAPKTP